MLAEASTKDISEAVNPETFEDSKKVAQQGGNVTKVARKELEQKTGKKVVSTENYLQLPEKQIQTVLVSFLVIFTLSLPIWIFMSRYISQKKLIILGGIVLGLSTVFIYPNMKGHSFSIIFLCVSVLGGLFVGVAVILETYLSQYLNRKEHELKQSVAGQYLGLWKMAQKISRAFAVAVSGQILLFSDKNPQTLANFFGYAVGGLFLISALIMLIPVSEE